MSGRDGFFGDLCASCAMKDSAVSEVEAVPPGSPLVCAQAGGPRLRRATQCCPAVTQRALLVQAVQFEPASNRGGVNGESEG